MKKAMRITGILFMAALILLILSCGDSSGDNDSPEYQATVQTDSARQNEQGQLTEEKTDVHSILASLPDEDYGGYEFRIWTSNQIGPIDTRQAPEEEQNADPVNDSLYIRDKLVEDKYNINIKYTVMEYGAILSKALNSVRAGDNEFDFVMDDMISLTSGLAQSGALVDFNEVPNVDLTKEWWSKYAIRDLTINGKFYFPTGDISTRYTLAPFLLMFNKKLFSDYGLEYPYQTVLDGKWTVDELTAIIKDKTYDLNGDGIIDKTDFFGMTVDEYPLAFIHSFGESIVKIVDGNPVFNVKNERMLAVMDKLASFWGDPNCMIGTRNYVGYDEVKIFKEDRALFVSTTVIDVSMYKDMESDFGVLPLPKYDVNQLEYYSSINPYASSAVCVPTTAENLGRTGMIIEALAASAKYLVTPAVYDITLKTKHARDEDSEAMLDLICAGSRYDFATLYDWGGVFTQFRITFNSGQSFVSRFESIENRAQSEMERTIQVFEEQ